MPKNDLKKSENPGDFARQHLEAATRLLQSQLGAVSKVTVRKLCDLAGDHPFANEVRRRLDSRGGLCQLTAREYHRLASLAAGQPDPAGIVSLVSAASTTAETGEVAVGVAPDPENTPAADNAENGDAGSGKKKRTKRNQKLRPDQQ